MICWVPFQCQGTKMNLLQLDLLMLGVAAGSAVPLVSLNAVGRVEWERHEPGQREPGRGGGGLRLRCQGEQLSRGMLRVSRLDPGEEQVPFK